MPWRSTLCAVPSPYFAHLPAPTTYTLHTCRPPATHALPYRRHGSLPFPTYIPPPPAPIIHQAWLFHVRRLGCACRRLTTIATCQHLPCRPGLCHVQPCDSSCGMAAFLSRPSTTLLPYLPPSPAAFLSFSLLITPPMASLGLLAFFLQEEEGHHCANSKTVYIPGRRTLRRQIWGRGKALMSLCPGRTYTIL